MEKTPLYTIGHGSRQAEELIALLKKYGIEYLVDARSIPYSRYHSQFNQNELKYRLQQQGIRYVYMGDELGGRPKDVSCYNSEGKVDYEILRTKDFFKTGIERLKTAYRKDLKLAIMCSERDPCECHRARLIGRVLAEENIILQHIDEKGKIKDQTTVINEINTGRSQKDLFNS